MQRRTHRAGPELELHLHAPGARPLPAARTGSVAHGRASHDRGVVHLRRAARARPRQRRRVGQYGPAAGGQPQPGRRRAFPLARTGRYHAPRGSYAGKRAGYPVGLRHPRGARGRGKSRARPSRRAHVGSGAARWPQEARCPLTSRAWRHRRIWRPRAAHVRQLPPLCKRLSPHRHGAALHRRPGKPRARALQERQGPHGRAVRLRAAHRGLLARLHRGRLPHDKRDQRPGYRARSSRPFARHDG